VNIAGGAHQGAPSNHVNAVVKGSRITETNSIRLLLFLHFIEIPPPIYTTGRPEQRSATAKGRLLDLSCQFTRTHGHGLPAYTVTKGISRYPSSKRPNQYPPYRGYFPIRLSKKKPQPHASSLQRARRAKSKSPVNPRLIRTAAMFLRCCVISLSV
jgi:hypothetical protein